MTGLRSLHANDDWIDGTYKFIRNCAAWRTRHFTHIHRHPEMLATRSTRQARVAFVVNHVYENTVIALYME